MGQSLARRGVAPDERSPCGSLRGREHVVRVSIIESVTPLRSLETVEDGDAGSGATTVANPSVFSFVLQTQAARDRRALEESLPSSLTPRECRGPPARRESRDPLRSHFEGDARAVKRREGWRPRMGRHARNGTRRLFDRASPSRSASIACIS